MSTPPNNAPEPPYSERHKTIRFIFGGLMALVALGMILGATVYIVKYLNDEPPWLTLALAIFGPTGTIVAVFTLYLQYLSKKNDQLNRRVDALLSGKTPKAKK